MVRLSSLVIIDIAGKFTKVANSAVFIFACLLGLTRLQRIQLRACCKVILWLRLSTRTMCSLWNVARLSSVNEQSV